MRSLLPALMCCLSLFSLETQPLVLPLPTQRQTDWLRFLRIPRLLETSPHLIIPTAPGLSVTNDNIALRDRRSWKALLHKGAMPGWPSPESDQNHLTTGEGLRRPRALRGRRHTNGGGGRGHAQLMRVGCVLGTCQVQNLSHRLYQLIGQRGREDSSPINPRSPHSYG